MSIKNDKLYQKFRPCFAVWHYTDIDHCSNNNYSNYDNENIDNNSVDKKHHASDDIPRDSEKLDTIKLGTLCHAIIMTSAARGGFRGGVPLPCVCAPKDMAFLSESSCLPSLFVSACVFVFGHYGVPEKNQCSKSHGVQP